MPFKRRYRKKRSTKVAPKVKRYVQKAIHKDVETKFANLNLTANFSSIGSGWTEYEMTNISQGTGISSRVGNQIRLRGLFIGGSIVGGQTNLATDDNRDTMRIIIALWDSANAIPLTTNLADMNSLVAKETSAGKGLVKKYVDTIVQLRSPGRDSTGYLPALRYFKKFVKLHNTLVRYAGSASTTANRKLVISMISDSALVSHPGFTQGRHTLYFEDA